MVHEHFLTLNHRIPERVRQDEIPIQTKMDIISKVNRLMARGETFCLATVIASTNPDIAIGGKAIVHFDGSVEANIGDSIPPGGLREPALVVLKQRNSRVIEIAAGIRVFFDVLTSENRLLICGAGHIALPLVGFCREAGFKISVLDDRADFANAQRFPDCEIIAEEFSRALSGFPMNASTYVVVITRGHEHDADCLMEVLKKDTAYVGLIGSRRRVRFVLEMLEKEGIPKKRLEEVFTPIGIPIGGESPAEIALSIAAELVCVRRKGPRQARLLRTAVGINP